MPMRHPRRTIVIALVTVLIVVGTFFWRRWFPFPDRIAPPYLPSNALAYLHVNLTPYTRHALRAMLARAGDAHALSVDIPSTFAQALAIREVRELGFIVLPDTGAHGVRIVIAIGQRASGTPDAVEAMSGDIG